MNQVQRRHFLLAAGSLLVSLPTTTLKGAVMRSLIIRIFVLVGLMFPALVSAVVPMAAAGTNSTIALKSNGTVVAWGNNNNGQLGVGTTTNSASPLVVPGLSGALAVSSSSIHTLTLKSNGTVVAWGLNNTGQLGDGTTTQRNSPVPVLGLGGAELNGVVAVAAGGNHSVALKSDGTVVAWGSNTYGQMGSSTFLTMGESTAWLAVPVTGVVAVAAGFAHTVALKSDGTVVAWGNNEQGQLGDGTTTNRSNPVAVPGLSGVVAVSAGLLHTVALKSDGTVVAWGFNYYGQLGDGTTTDRHGPVLVPNLTGALAVSAGGLHTIAITSASKVVAWGFNANGQLGDGTTTDRRSPVAVQGLTGVAAVSASGHSVALKSDGTVAAWGLNSSGQLGDGTTTQRNSQVAVAGLSLGVVPISNARLFAYAEANFSSIFKGPPSAGQYQQYSYRYYPTSGNYLAVDSSSAIFVLGPYTGGVLSPVGAVESFRSYITAWEAT
jgi:alpha-tubulin suppressor-like RCC1 family protein